LNVVGNLKWFINSNMIRVYSAYSGSVKWQAAMAFSMLNKITGRILTSWTSITCSSTTLLLVSFLVVPTCSHCTFA
jgi:hypothetical protein